MATLSKEKENNNPPNSTIIPLIEKSKIKNLFNFQKLKNNNKETKWKNSSIYNNIPNYDSSKDKSLLYNKIKKFLKYKRQKNYLSPNSRKINMLNKTNIDKIKINDNNINNIYTYRKKFSSFQKKIKILSTKNKNKSISFIGKKSSSPLTTRISLNFTNDGNISQSFNLYKLWDELAVLKPYRSHFNFIYKELETEYREELYKKEIQELNKVKMNIKSLKYYIGIRLEIIQDIKSLNEKLGQEIIKNNNNAKEIILSDICNKIVLLRE
jgi:hypothetical protein